MSMSKSLHKMAHAEDPRTAVLEAMGDLSGIQLTGRQVMVGIYMRPEKTKGGIFLTDKAKDEDLHQGKVGLIVKVGPNAFKSDDEHSFPGTPPMVGDWVFFRVADGWCLSVNGRISRIMQDVNVRGVLDHPDTVL